MNEFKLVTLPGIKRRCLACVSEDYRLGGDESRPHYPEDDDGFNDSDRHLPQRWRVIGEVIVPLGHPRVGDDAFADKLIRDLQAIFLGLKRAGPPDPEQAEPWVEPDTSPLRLWDRVQR